MSAQENDSTFATSTRNAMKASTRSFELPRCPRVASTSAAFTYIESQFFGVSCYMIGEENKLTYSSTSSSGKNIYLWKDRVTCLEQK